MKTVRFLIVMMLLASLFVGIPVKSGWVLLYMFEFDQIPKEVVPDFGPFYLVLWLLLLITHFGIALLIFWINRSYFRTLLIWIPLIFTALYAILQPISVLFLIPFIVTWLLTTLREWERRKN